MWLTVGIGVAKALMVASNIVEKIPHGLKGKDKLGLAMDILRDVGCPGQAGMPNVADLPQDPEVQEKYHEFVKAYVALQNAIAKSQSAK